MLAGLCCKPTQVSRSAEDLDEQPRKAPALPTHIPRGPHRGRAVHRREELLDPTDRAASASSGRATDSAIASVGSEYDVYLLGFAYHGV